MFNFIIFVNIVNFVVIKGEFLILLFDVKLLYCCEVFGRGLGFESYVFV